MKIEKHTHTVAIHSVNFLVCFEGKLPSDEK